MTRPNELWLKNSKYLEVKKVVKGQGGEGNVRHDGSGKCENGQSNNYSVDGPESGWEFA